MQLVELPDGSGFGLASLPLPKDHWIYEKRDYPETTVGTISHLVNTESDQEIVAQIVTAAKLAIQGATMCGKEMDFDPDALILNLIVELIGSRKCTVTETVSSDPV